MNKPYVNCIMMTSIDGRIDGSFFEHSDAEIIGDIYEQIKIKNGDAWGNGSTTHKMYFSDESIDLDKYKGQEIAYEDNIIVDEDHPYVVSFDSKGSVKWADKYLEYPEGEKSRVLIITTKQARPEYIAYLKDMNISYIFAGESKIDVKIAMDKLYNLFNIKRFALTGGGIINGEFFKQDLIDEVTTVIAPYIEGTGTKTIADAGVSLAKQFKLKEMKKLDADGVMLSYVK